jgi:GlpG protein
VTGGIGLMALAVTGMTFSGRWSVARFEVGPTTFWSEPWRLSTSALPQGDLLHLAFNLYWLWVLGTLLEEILGHVRLLGLVIFFAAGSAAAAHALEVGGAGLSGVGYGLFALAWVLSKRDRRLASAVDKPTVQVFAGWFVLCIVLTRLNVMSVANVAHAAGTILGALVGAAMIARTLPLRALSVAGVAAVCAASAAGATVLRPRVNLSPESAENMSFQLGYDAIQEGRFEDAVRHFQDALAMKSDNARAWYNLGIACEHAQRDAEALAAYRRAYEAPPHDSRHRLVFAAFSRHLAAKAEQRGDHEEALSLLRGEVEATPEDAYAWIELSAAYRAVGKPAEAEAAMAEAHKRQPGAAP